MSCWSRFADRGRSGGDEVVLQDAEGPLLLGERAVLLLLATLGSPALGELELRVGALVAQGERALVALQRRPEDAVDVHHEAVPHELLDALGHLDDAAGGVCPDLGGDLDGQLAQVVVDQGVAVLRTALDGLVDALAVDLALRHAVFFLPDTDRYAL